MFSRGWRRMFFFFTFRSAEPSLPSAGECRARRGAENNGRTLMVSGRDNNQNTWVQRSNDRSKLSLSLSDIISESPPPHPLHFVWGQPGAVCTPCCSQLLQALLQVYCQAHFLGFRPVPLSHVTLQGPRVQRETRYGILVLTGGWSSERYHRGVIFIGRYIKHEAIFSADAVTEERKRWRCSLWKRFS